MLKGILCADAFDRVHLEHSGEEVKSLVIEKSTQNSLEGLSSELWEALLPIWESSDTRPGRVIREPKDLEDLEELVDLAVSGEEWRLHQHLSPDTRDGPDVNRCAVVSAAQEDLRWPVPKCDYLVCKLANRNTKCPRQTKVPDLQDRGLGCVADAKE